LRTLGLDSRTARVPALVALAAHAAHGQTELLDCRISQFALPGAAAGEQERTYCVVSVARPDLEIGPTLSTAEYAVARLLVEGKSYAEMALLRGTSVRTVANQVASVFQKVGVSGRSEFLSSLARGAGHVEAAPLELARTAGVTDNVVPIRAAERRANIGRPTSALRLADHASARWNTSVRLDAASNSGSIPATSGSAASAR
jgi:DNA-binding CsgD family transcriptional regulator